MKFRLIPRFLSSLPFSKYGLKNFSLLFLCLFLPPLLIAKPQSKHSFNGISQSETLLATAEVDKYIETEIHKQGLKRNPPISDHVFVRRIYLDIAGRIPTYQETLDFLNSKNPKKRSDLIDHLLQSEAYVSNFFHFWADLLRLKTRHGRLPGMVSYIEWVKQSLRTNKAYDQLVRELITAEGYPWENPAVGYYLRDAGMPLDHMSNTAQVFLGTRMQCAQCHNHPFDKWTQKDYYHMAAYTYNVQTQRPIRDLDLFKSMQKELRKEMQKNRRINDKKNIRPTGAQRRALREAFTPLIAEAVETKRKLRLPKDYKYEDGKPKDLVQAKVPFGDSIMEQNTQSVRESYADWMVSPKNPRFTSVISNRLWKKVMGRGLFEPIDDLKDDTEPSHPQLMKYLNQLMVGYDYDMKQYLRILFNSRTYQSEVADAEPAKGKVYHFQGPLLRRMSAEQLWDSVLTLIVPDLDSRKGADPQVIQQASREKIFQKRVANLEKIDGTKLYGMIKKIGEIDTRFRETEKELRQKIQDVENQKEIQPLRRQLFKARRQRQQDINQLLAFDTAGMSSNDENSMMSQNSLRQEQRQKAKEDNPKWKPHSRNLVRASEIQSPAPAGHFLRQFGQADREVIDNSHQEASIPQVLSLLNGSYLYQVTNKNSLLSQNLAPIKNGKKKVDVVFLSFFSRPPTSEERELISNHVKENDQWTAYQNLISSLLNTQTFSFVE